MINAIYHFSMKIISRGKGKSAVGAAAYRSGQKLTNEYDGLTHDYTRKGGVVHTEILLPEHAPPEYAGRSTLWNAVEKVEKARNSQLAREIEISLPNELSRADNIELARRFVQDTFVSKGMCADVCIHDPERDQPTIHMGVSATQMERKGIRTEKGNINRRIKAQNDELHRLQAELERVNAAIAELQKRPQEENLVSILMRFYGNGEKFAEARGLKLGNLKKAAKLRDVTRAVAFLNGHNIRTMSELSEKHAALEAEYTDRMREAGSKNSTFLLEST